MLGAIVLAGEDGPIAVLNARRINLSRAQVVVFVVVDGESIDGGQARAQRDERHGEGGEDEEQAFQSFWGHRRLSANGTDY